MSAPPVRLPPTSPEITNPVSRPYFLWWTGVTVAEFQKLLQSDDQDTRAYWLGALLREANTRDVWLFTSPTEIRLLWPRLIRHLGRSREMWAYLLGLEAGDWPPRQAQVA